MACELDALDQDLDAADPEHCAPDADELIDQVALNHTHWEYLVEVVESEDHHSLVIEAVDVQPDVIEAQRNGLDDIIGVLVHIL